MIATDGKGSPPLTRGKAVMAKVRVWLSRITPAYAGKSAPCGAAPDFMPDHPRLRGEKGGGGGSGVFHGGSPPLTRGKVLLPRQADYSRRITPAYAGKSFSEKSAVTEAWDHPRLRGEKLHTIRARVYIWGSPPLTRGKDTASPGR